MLQKYRVNHICFRYLYNIIIYWSPCIYHKTRFLTSFRVIASCIYFLPPAQQIFSNEPKLFAVVKNYSLNCWRVYDNIIQRWYIKKKISTPTAISFLPLGRVSLISETIYLIIIVIIIIALTKKEKKTFAEGNVKHLNINVFTSGNFLMKELFSWKLVMR